MDHRCDLDPNIRARRKYYTKLRQLLDELDSSPPKDETTKVALRREDAALKNVKEEEIYGVITKDEFESIIAAYDKQQSDQKLLGKPVKCDNVRGGSFATLLFSKPGFHHPGSTEFLIDKLGIKDRNRDSFLGGYSNYLPSPNISVDFIVKTQKRLHIQEEAKRIYSLIEKEGDHNQITESIHKIIKLDEGNADARAIRGKWCLRCRRYDQAIDDLKAALDIGCWDSVAISNDLSEACCQVGLTLYAKGDYQQAMDKFTMSWNYNVNNETAKLHMSLCRDVLERKFRPFGTTNSFANRRK